MSLSFGQVKRQGNGQDICPCANNNARMQEDRYVMVILHHAALLINALTLMTFNLLIASLIFQISSAILILHSKMVKQCTKMAVMCSHRIKHD